MRSIVEEALTKARDETASPSQNNEDLDQILSELKTEITVIGCGGSGSNTITRMMEEGIHGAKLIAVNTDAQHLIRTHADQRMLIGRQRTGASAPAPSRRSARKPLSRTSRTYGLPSPAAT